jgi:hypothetical protein
MAGQQLLIQHDEQLIEYDVLVQQLFQLYAFVFRLHEEIDNYIMIYDYLIKEMILNQANIHLEHDQVHVHHFHVMFEF